MESTYCQVYPTLPLSSYESNPQDISYYHGIGLSTSSQSFYTNVTSRPTILSLKEDSKHSLDEIENMKLCELEQLQLIPNSKKFRLMLCETFVSTGACIFHDDKLNLCAFAHDKRIQSHISFTLLNDIEKEQCKNERKKSLKKMFPTKQNNFTFPIHWPNLQTSPSPSKKLGEISKYIKYHEAENLRAFKQKLIKRCVFYFWDSFLVNLEVIQQLGEPNSSIETTCNQLSQSQYHIRSTTRFDYRKYCSRRLPVFVEISQSQHETQF